MKPSQIKKPHLVEAFFQYFYGCSREDFEIVLYGEALRSSSEKEAIERAATEMEKRRRNRNERPAELDPTSDPEDSFEFDS